ncbi:MAG: hypothetical protein PVJ67_03030 [Candidatus Pacearchaeota archaeon]|jgi:hypothetical protein
MKSRSAEVFFLKYAFPCANVLLQKGTISREDYDLLEDATKKKEVLSREFLEKCFPAAFRRIKKLAETMQRNYWDIEVMKEYWHHDHNLNIDAGEGNYSKFPNSFCDFCKVHIAEVEKILPQGFLLIKYGDIERPVNSEYISDIKVGDKVRIHHAYAIEKVEI